MKKLLVFFYLLLWSSAVFAQNKASIKGILLDSVSKKPVEHATVAIVNQKDTTLISYTISQKDGSFKLTGLPVGRETKLIISIMNFNTVRRTFVFKPAETKDIGEVLLTGKVLTEVVIKGERTPVVMKKDTIEFNTEAFKTRPNAVVEDLLRLLPGVQVDYDGTVTVNGKEISKLLIDGKRFFGSDPKVATKNLDADMIDKIQVYDDRDDDPDHKKNSVEVSKIINLKMKSKIKKSTLGKIYGGIGSRDRYEAGGILSSFRDTLQVSVIGLANNLNKTGFSQDELYTMGGFNRSGGNQAWDGTFGGNGWGGIERVISSGLNINNDYGKKLKMNLSYFYTKSSQDYDSKSTNEQTLPQTVLKSTSNYNTTQNSQKHNITGLIEWAPDTIRRIKYEPKLNFNPSGDVTSSSENSSNTLTPRLTESINRSNTSGFNNTFSHEFSFYTKLKRKDESFRLAHTLSLNKSGSTEFDYNNLVSYTADIQSQVLNRLGDNNRHDNSAGISETYSRRFSKKISAELFSNSRYLTTLQQVSLYNKNTTSGLYDQFLPDQSNKLMRYWFVQNLRPQLSYEFNDKLTARAGLNSEFQYINNQFNSTVANIANHYFFFFPEFELSGDGYSINYSESIDQPEIYQLQPITRIYNQLYKSTGNPNLEPSRVRSIYARYYKYNYDKQVNFNLYSSLTLKNNNVIESTTRDTVGAITQTYVNRNGGWRGYFGGSWGKQFKKTQKWQIGLNTNFSGNADHGSFFFNGDEGTRSNYSFNLKQNINFNYNAVISFNTNYNINENITRYGRVNYPSVNTLRHTVGTDVTVRWPARMIFDAKYGYNYNPQVAEGFPRSSNLVDLAVTFMMFKKDRGQLKLSVYDLLDQSVAVYRYAYINSITTSEHQILKRYFMLTYQYKLNIFKSK